jgi:hypothetical protein
VPVAQNEIAAAWNAPIDLRRLQPPRFPHFSIEAIGHRPVGVHQLDRLDRYTAAIRRAEMD